MASDSWTHDDYNVGWVCAIPKEQTAAIACRQAIGDSGVFPDLTYVASTAVLGGGASSQRDSFKQWLKQTSREEASTPTQACVIHS